jgi:hypothetical protein
LGHLLPWYQCLFICEPPPSVCEVLNSRNVYDSAWSPVWGVELGVELVRMTAWVAQDLSAVKNHRLTAQASALGLSDVLCAGCGAQQQHVA